MFYYFGRKGRLASKYPAPRYPLVIEPFAGSMAFTLAHTPPEAVGIEADEAVVEVWRQVTQLRPDEILALHEPSIGDVVTDRWSMMAAGSHGTARASGYTWTDRMARDLAKQKRMAARSVEYAARAVDYQHGDYRDAPDVEATWFIRPALPASAPRLQAGRSGL